MQWSEAIKEYTQSIKPLNVSPEMIRRVYNLIDLTSLNDHDTPESIAFLCEKANLPWGHVAAICTFPSFVRQVAADFGHSQIKVATVANFPEGNASLDNVILEIGRAIEDGAQEIEVVFPYHRYLAGETQYAHTFVAACRAACGEDATLKVILETGELMDPSIIADASYEVITAGADFIKTSTGKTSQGATLDAAAVMLLVVKHVTPQIKRNVGVKVSGGIRELQQAISYVALADHIMGQAWVSPETFRMGASKLVDEIIAFSAKQ